MKTLTEKDLVIGQKYTPISKSVFGPLECSTEWEKAQNKGQYFLYYKGGSNGCFGFGYENDSSFADFFLPSDMVPYIDVKAINSKRKFLVVSSTEGELAIPLTLQQIIQSDTSEKREMLYCLYDHMDDILDLRLFDSMKFQPNRDDKNSKDVIIRIS